MPTRTITGSISVNSTTDLKGGGYAGFTVTSDTGAIANGQATAGRLNTSSIRTYATTAYLDVKFGSADGTTLASTGALTSNSSSHSEDFTLSSLNAGLLTGSPSMVYLAVVATSGTGNKINFRDGCTITLEIDYTLPPSKCTAPSGVKVSASTSTGDNVTLSWNAGGDGTNNPLSYYQIARKESSDGSTWGSLETYKDNAGNVTSYSVPPPVSYGHQYRYYVRAVGTAGTSYASDWAECSATLQKLRPSLVSYTDPTITAGTTKIKAAHITELQTNVNRLRNGLGLASYAFTSIQAGYTSLGGWSGHVAELRAAIDEMGVTHDAWISIPVNCPTAAVMQQLRQVVAAI